MNANILEKANQIVKTSSKAQIGVIDENGFPSVSTVSVINPESIYETYLSTGLGSNKVRRLSKDNRASICYCVGGDNITLVGEAEILTDQPTKDRLWQDWFINHFPGGKTDPNYCIIKIKTKRVSLWVAQESVESEV